MTAVWVIYLVIGAVILVAAVMSFFVRRHGEAQTPAGDWIRTDEVFVDPTTRRQMRVWIDPVDNSRHYVPDA